VRPNPETNEQKAWNSTKATKRDIKTEAQGKLHLSVSMSVACIRKLGFHVCGPSLAPLFDISFK
jgi:hypothetical protein